MRQIADGEPWRMPATIDDPVILDEITGVMSERGMVKPTEGSTA
jgi:propionyl-CoA synthetase